MKTYTSEFFSVSHCLEPEIKNINVQMALSELYQQLLHATSSYSHSFHIY
ncbi:hypothetical protein CDIV41_270157 [Carnobacterium divergens]|nr:hypothetical protein CDIV41_270157 [Carnobacterium divergens]